ncbi:MAG: patatin-like phospholipase family protein [Saprospiraceae bacterium]|nr:patatin-like phospholipase family protein [Saprospiraceae bacterium]
MKENEEIDHSNLPSYVTRSKEVIEIEIEHYLKQHREANGIQEPPQPDNLSGLCISGGGVRAATLGLGMIQAFIKARKMIRFDYLSTVSGGGYIGACLSSLLSEEPQKRNKGWQANESEDIINQNTKFNVADYGLEEHNSPFTNEPYEYPKLEHAKLSTRHQLIHLRQHGEYLTPHKSVRDWDVHRLIGALFGGVITNITTFILLLSVVVLMHHLLLAVMSHDSFFERLQDPIPAANQILKEQDDHALAAFLADSTLAKQNGRVIKKTRPVVDSSRYFRSIQTACPDSVWRQMNTAQRLSAWGSHSLGPQLALVWLGVWRHWDMAAVFAGLGFLLAILFLIWARTIPYRVVRQEQDEQNFTGDHPNDVKHPRKGEEDMLDALEKPLIWWFYHVGLWGVPLAAYTITAFITHFEGNSFNFFVMLALPLCYSLGLYIGLHFWIYVYFINNAKERVSGWLYRSFYAGLQGGALLMVFITILFPIAIILLFGGHGLAVQLSFSFVPVATAYYFTMQSLGGRVGGGGMLSTMMSKLQNPLLNLSIFLFIGLTFAWISTFLYSIEQVLLHELTPYISTDHDHSRTLLVGAMFLISLVLLIMLGFVVNANDVSLHYFYRDRLSEAYLRTIGRVEVRIKGALGGKKLQRVTLRSHDDLQLRNLGAGSYKAPYHIIVTALNLQGSHDLSAKTLKSEHFIFSKFFIGSRSTGYVATHAYNFGSTKLSTAMAISAAAVSSGMGPIGFTASNFYMTLFNLRTGYWIDNPKHFIKRKIWKAQSLEASENQPNGKKRKPWTFKNELARKWDNWTNKYPFWLSYVGKELTGNLSSNSQKVYVSDGGHTGDNLGILPLIQRQCSTIVVADFEEDGTFSFESFNQAVRLAKSIYNADINIDISKLSPVPAESGGRFSPVSVAEGVIVYHMVEEIKDGDEVVERKFYKKTGQLIYMKSTVSLLKGADEIFDDTSAPPPVSEGAPVFVLNYLKKNPKFPHQSTSDQYFDEVQFEAYRMLGEHIGKQAASKVRFEALKSQ